MINHHVSAELAAVRRSLELLKRENRHLRHLGRKILQQVCCSYDHDHNHDVIVIYHDHNYGHLDHDHSHDIIVIFHDHNHGQLDHDIIMVYLAFRC